LLQLLISSEQVQSRNRALCLFTPLARNSCKRAAFYCALQP